MKEFLIVAVAVFSLVFLWLIMKRLDVFLDENRKSIEKREEECEPSYIIIPKDADDEETLRIIKNYKKDHGDIILSDPSEK